ncbi:glycosyltransferase family 2 protein [Actinocrispum wychmicini]|uniref:4,4'-diaponeurosporenoate glycosyltransferase n=1 Tax=Actinocrispum wychmicini TaxID=1213861 RepID=A0A4R2K3X6_9PSEU|nr:glycosyltransferase family 2 protein [Actinocrispum wychmicini]TCO64489.1 glycosyltransferase involved in cell wall biosynthesis [Actinocrispum wychmicini]
MNANQPSLSIVIPVFNEEEWITRSVTAVVAATRQAEWPAEIIVVDDGSTDGTPQALVQLAAEHGIVVITQANKGRFAARRTGLAKASGEMLLLVDSRIIVDESALAFLKNQLRAHPDRRVWTGHVRIDDDGNPYSGFLSAMVKIPWRRYFGNPRLMSFSIDEFDVFPKGTGYFAAPRALFEQATEQFESLYDDQRLASDDTRLLRWIAERERIWLAPEFSCTYHGRDSLAKFTKHAFFRGTTFVDGYLQSKGPARRGLFAVVGVGLASVALLLRRPKTAIAVGMAGSAAAGVAVRRFGATKSEAKAFARLLPLFGFSFLAGALRGLALAARRRR